MDRKIQIKLGMDFAEARGFYSTKLAIRNEGGIRVQCTGIFGNNGLKIRQKEGLSLNLLKGYFLRMKSPSGNEILRITDVDMNGSLLYVEGDARRIPAGRTLVIDSGEPMPLMAARLLSGTTLGASLPLCEIEIEMDRHPPEDTVIPFILLTTRNESGLCQGSSLDPVSVRERISEQGEILEPLEESEINRILRKVYEKNQDAVVLIMLKNSGLNPVHERVLHNLLQAAGYKKTYVSHTPYSILSVLPFVGKDFAVTCLKPMLDSYRQMVKEKLGKDSSFSLIL